MTGLVPMVAARVFLICVMPAIFEEIGFRGLVQTWLMRVIGPWKAVALSAALFSAIHFSVLSSPYLFLVGALLAWTRWKSGLLFPGILLHFLHNLAVLWYEGLLT
ncbi:CPBP family intramembrane glutamic endopeptidase [Verrucomicrobium spinosum]|uniref:CPBP family intramembrane glutamic endopeptidase n=1 Tax=Verrucomicrobium spinosum TaxID=2736 RepID=UPI00155DCFCA|nr:CPBP family intramembrane glutamic endopeptidase [Verrucomicrobium spinosum]